MSIGPIGDLGETSTAISQQAQFIAQQNQVRTQQAQDAADQQARLADQATLAADQAQRTVLARQDERQAQLEAQAEAQQRADDRQAALEAFGIQQAQLQDVILADQDLQATSSNQEVTADQNLTDQPSFDQTAVNALLNGNSTVGTVQDALDEFQQLDDATGLEVSQVTVTLTQSGNEIDTQL
jgi:hypothetical protein